MKAERIEDSDAATAPARGLIPRRARMLPQQELPVRPAISKNFSSKGAEACAIR
jgi:hypothetical protein